jgi:predicted ATP-grasp superfamily ATP-dependent carboligase
MYTGGLENRRGLVSRINRGRPLWGNNAAVLRRARSPQTLLAACRDAGIRCPAFYQRALDLPQQQRWLEKPLAGAGGSGIRFWAGGTLAARDNRVYYQQFIEGESCSAVFVGDGRGARLLGLTRQLVGVPWLHARTFSYCGSIGPLGLPAALWGAVDRLGNVLAASAGLRGLFGVDCIVQDGLLWPVEVNPRYTASVEVLEFGQNVAALALHQQAFAPGCLREENRPDYNALDRLGVIGKAIVFAQTALVFPENGPWMQALHLIRACPAGADLDQPPAFADIPHAGQRIESGRPILTFFARADSVASCLENLRQIAADLDPLLGNT